MAKEKKLARGLSSIFGDDIDSVLQDIDRGEGIAQGNAVSLRVNEIRPNPYQPRKVFDETALKELAASIKEHGVFQPILVRKAIQGYELIAGERRLRATKLNKMEEIPAIILDFDDVAMMEISLLENIQREDLSVIEEAKAYDSLIHRLDYTQEELAKRVGKSRTHITNILRLLKLPSELQAMVDSGALSYGHARALLAVDEVDKMEQLAQRVVKEGLSVREIEKLVQKKDKQPVEKEVDPYLDNVRIRLQKQFQTAVEVSKNKIVLNYRDTADLNRILELLGALEDC